MTAAKINTYGATDKFSDSDASLIPRNENNQPQPKGKKEELTIPTPIAIAMANLAGILGIMQTGTNTSLCREFFPNPVASCGISFVVGLLTMIVICLIDEASLPRMEKLRDCPWYCFIGGVLGGTYKTAAIILAPRVGFATFHIAAVAGQLIAGIFCDLIGFLEIRSSHPSPFKVLCAVAVLIGTGMSTEGVGVIEPDSLSNHAAVIGVVIACLSGSVLPIQALINHQLADHVGTTFHAVTINFFVGSAVMWTVVGLELGDSKLIHEKEPIFQVHNESYRDLWWVWTGGSMGAILIVCVTLALPSLGAATFSLIFISTQLVSAVLADSIGAFGFERVPLSTSGYQRVLGVLLATLAASLCNLKLPACLGMLNDWPSDCRSSPKSPFFSHLSPVVTRIPRHSIGHPKSSNGL